MNISSSALFSSARTDLVNKQLINIASSGLVFDQTSKAKISNHDTDKQAEDNATWFFEYKALLNSKLTTLTTSLTSAYTTDLDSCMAASAVLSAGQNWGSKNAMQGLTGQKPALATEPLIDPGAARTSSAYMLRYGRAGAATTSSGTWDGNSTNVAADAAVSVSTSTATAGSSISGTTTFISGNGFALDSLDINFGDTTQNKYNIAKNAAILLDRQGQIASSAVEQGFKIGNNFELTLYKFFAKPENFDIIRFGLFQNLYVVGTSSLATGSQVQGSISLNWNDTNASAPGKIDIKQERFAAFFHS